MPSRWAEDINQNIILAIGHIEHRTMSIADSIYNHTPIMIQNLLISAYGYKLKRARYGGEFDRNYNNAKEAYRFDEKQIYELQKRLLAEIVRAAARYTPHYMNSVKITDSEISNITPEALVDYFPVLDKNTIRESQKSFYNQNIANSTVYHINTSGTTGTPLKIAVTNSSVQKNYAYFARFLDIAGVSRHERSATFAGRMIIPDSQNKPPYWRYNLANNNLLLSSYRASDKTIPSYIKALEKWQPKFIDSYPSAIYILAKYIVDNEVKHTIRPTTIITSSEMLIDDHRRTIETAFGCKVYDHYGCAEMAAFITQCKHGSYHINADYGLIEVLDDNERPVRAGEIGEIVCTGFINQAMPLIRYRIGDSAILSGRKCDCGCHFPVIESIIGRSDDLIITPDGRKVGRLDPVFKGLSGIKETQIVQTHINEIQINIVRDVTYTDNSANTLISELSRRVGDDMKISVVFRDVIPKSKSGKFKTVISKLNS